MRILLVEDERRIGEAVSVALKDAAHGVDWVARDRFAHPSREA